MTCEPINITYLNIIKKNFYFFIFLNLNQIYLNLLK